MRKFITVLLSTDVIAELRRMAEQRGEIVRRGPGAGGGSIAKLLTSLARDNSKSR